MRDAIIYAWVVGVENTKERETKGPTARSERTAMEQAPYMGGETPSGPIGLQRSATEPVRTPDGHHGQNGTGGGVSLGQGPTPDSRRMSASNVAADNGQQARPAGYMSSTGTVADDRPVQTQTVTVPAQREPSVDSPTFAYGRDPALKVHAKVNEDIYTATYSGIPVFEMVVNGVAVMRRRQDSSLNATQILKVAGVEKSKRTKVLEKEIHTGEHEKVQGGYGKYQGTWIPYERGVELCRKYGVYESIEPLLTFDPSGVDIDKTPTKEQAMAAKRKRSSTAAAAAYTPTAQLQHTHSLTFAHPLQVTGTGASARPTPLANSASAALSSLGKPADPGVAPGVGQDGDSYERDYMYLAHGNKRLRYEQAAAAAHAVVDGANGTTGTRAGGGGGAGAGSGAGAGGTPTGGGSGSGSGNGGNNALSASSAAAAAAAVAAAVDVLDDEGVPDSNVPLSPLPESGPNFEESRELVTQIFINTDCSNLEELMGGRDRIDMINVDVPIDESGHTALHWAAALARIPLVKELIKYGANPRRGNYNGETPLVRAVLVTNNSDLSLLPELLDMLYPAIPLADSMGRTVLHHIALTAGIKGRSDASRYYLESLLEWIVRRGSRSKNGRLGLGRFMREIVNAQDKNGDTALNIATRVGNKSIAQQLLDVGADPNIPNRAQLRPIDFGLKVLADGGVDGTAGSTGRPSAALLSSSAALIAQSAGAEPSGGNGGSGGSGGTASATERRQKIVQSMHSAVDDVELDFQRELEAKQRHIEDMHAQLREATIALAGRKERHTQLKSLLDQLVGLQRSAQNLERAIHDEDRSFKEVEERTGRAIQSSLGFDGNFDADQPFRIWLESDDVVQGKIPPLLLKARITAYKRNEAKLIERANELRGRSVELERKFRRIVSLGTQVPEDQVDMILSGLVQAVESDGPNVDISRVAGFMRKVDEGAET